MRPRTRGRNKLESVIKHDGVRLRESNPRLVYNRQPAGRNGNYQPTLFDHYITLIRILLTGPPTRTARSTPLCLRPSANRSSSGRQFVLFHITHTHELVKVRVQSPVIELRAVLLVLRILGGQPFERIVAGDDNEPVLLEASQIVHE